MERKMLGLGVREREGIGGTATTPAVQWYAARDCDILNEDVEAMSGVGVRSR